MLGGSMQRKSSRRKIVADGTVKVSGGDHVFRKSPREAKSVESDGSQPIDTVTDDSEARNDLLSKGPTFIVITLNQEFNSMCFRKNHPRYHFNNLMLSGEQALPWMCCWKAVFMITGTLMATETYRKFGPVLRRSQ